MDSDRLNENVFDVVDGKAKHVHLGDPYDGVSVDPVVEKIVEGTLKTTRESWAIRAQKGHLVRSVPKRMRYKTIILVICISSCIHPDLK